jgi:hypothetical protein
MKSVMIVKIIILNIISSFNISYYIYSLICIFFSRIRQLYLLVQMQSVPDLDKERPYAIPLVKPLPMPHLHE